MKPPPSQTQRCQQPLPPPTPDPLFCPTLDEDMMNMDEPEQMWDSLCLSSLVPLHNPHSPPHSPHQSDDEETPALPEPTWWPRRSASPVLQVHLNGEVVDGSDLSTATNGTEAALSASNNSTKPLEPLSVASGRVEKPKNNPKSPTRPSSSTSSSSSSAAAKQQPHLIGPSPSSIPPTPSSNVARLARQPPLYNDIMNTAPSDSPDAPVLPNDAKSPTPQIVPTTPTDMDTCNNINVNLNPSTPRIANNESPVTSLISTPPSYLQQQRAHPQRHSSLSSSPVKAEPLTLMPSSASPQPDLKSKQQQQHQVASSQGHAHKVQAVRPRPMSIPCPTKPMQSAIFPSPAVPSRQGAVHAAVGFSGPDKAEKLLRPSLSSSTSSSSLTTSNAKARVNSNFNSNSNTNKNNNNGTSSTSLKEKRQREARQFPKEALQNLDGTTSAEVRKMNSVERELVLYKRKLRNRESARRSRQKRQATLGELQDEIDDLVNVSERMVDVGLCLRQENDTLRNRLTCALAELKGLRAFAAKGPPSSDGKNKANNLSQSSALNMKLGG